MVRWAVISIGILVLLFAPIAWRARRIYLRIHERDGAAAARARAMLECARLITLVTTCVPLLWHVSRLTGYTSIAEVSLMITFAFLLVAPCALLAWLALAVARRVAAKGTDEIRRIPVDEMLLYSFFWMVSVYLFRLLPLFAGESGVHPSILDPWFSRLL